MIDFAKTLRYQADLFGQSEYQVAKHSGLDPGNVRRLFDGERQPSNLTLVRLALALVVDLELHDRHPADVSLILEKLEGAQISDAIAKLSWSRVRADQPL